MRAPLPAKTCQLDCHIGDDAKSASASSTGATACTAEVMGGRFPLAMTMSATQRYTLQGSSAFSSTSTGDATQEPTGL
jgi:hypothetical protein